MQIKLSQKVIKERCGAVSFKRGDIFYRNGKVTIIEVTPNTLQATVQGVEDFHVHLEKHPKGFQASCSCPSLSSFDKDCQHVAAVLLAWQHHQKKLQLDSRNADPIEGELSGELLHLFEAEQPFPVSGEQIHFETRQVLDTTFFCKGVTIEGDARFGIEISIASQKITDIRHFLESVRERRYDHISNELLYDPSEHCFDNATDAVIQQLILVMIDEKIYRRATPAACHSDEGMLIIPASFWKRIEPLLMRAPRVILQYSGQSYHHFSVTDEPLPLTFKFMGTEGNGYRLIIHGLSEMIILKEYDTVLSAGKVVIVKRREAERLYELKRMLTRSRTNEIAIPSHQLKYYMEQLLPHLRSMGEVHLSEEITAQLHKTPLQAKLYLDRVKNRLLAGLEFHYESVVINPLDSRQPRVGSLIIRDMEKEEEILQLMEQGKFTQTESSYYLHNEELEYHFLYHELPKLQKVVQVYATTAVRVRILPKTTIPKIKVRHYKERTHWLEFTFNFQMRGLTPPSLDGIRF